MSVFMCTILAGDDRNNMYTCGYFCAKYLVVTTEMMSACLYLCNVHVLVTIEIICLHVCIYVYNTYWWREK